jgi:hypothetical protein
VIDFSFQQNKQPKKKERALAFSWNIIELTAMIPGSSKNENKW